VSRRVLRWEVPVDGAWHVVPFVGSVLHVACRDPRLVEVWTSEDVSVSRTSYGTGRQSGETVTARPGRVNEREFRAFGTGMEVDGLYHGTALAPGGLVWHLFSRFVPREGP
jgi:hypothetical protein